MCPSKNLNTKHYITVKKPHHSDVTLRCDAKIVEWFLLNANEMENMI